MSRGEVGDVGTVSRGNVVIGNDVWVGHRASILSCLRIDDGAMIGARAVVTSDVEPYSIVAGNPSRPRIISSSEWDFGYVL